MSEKKTDDLDFGDLEIPKITPPDILNQRTSEKKTDDLDFGDLESPKIYPSDILGEKNLEKHDDNSSDLDFGDFGDFGDPTSVPPLGEKKMSKKEEDPSNFGKISSELDFDDIDFGEEDGCHGGSGSVSDDEIDFTTTEVSPSSVTKILPTVTETLPTVTGTLPTVTGTLPTVTGTLPTVTGTLPTVTGTFPTVTGTLPTVTGMFPTVTGTLPTVTGTFPTVTGTLPTATETFPTVARTSDDSFFDNTPVLLELDHDSPSPNLPSTTIPSIPINRPTLPSLHKLTSYPPPSRGRSSSSSLVEKYRPVVITSSKGGGTGLTTVQVSTRGQGDSWPSGGNRRLTGSLSPTEHRKTDEQSNSDNSKSKSVEREIPVWQKKLLIKRASGKEPNSNRPRRFSAPHMRVPAALEFWKAQEKK